MTYRLPKGYRSQDPAPYKPTKGGPVWQPDVLPYAADLADLDGAKRIIDIGCGPADKLRPLADRFDVFGIDLDPPGHDWGTFVAHDLDTPGRIPVDRRLLRRSVLVCSDVLEHMAHPEHLAEGLLDLLDKAPAAVLSTADRVRTRGADDLGPPRNPCHAREWSAEEFTRWLTDVGFTVVEQFWQRSKDAPGALEATAVVVVTG